MVVDYGSHKSFWEEVGAIIKVVESHPKREQKHHLAWFYDNIKDLYEREQKL